MFKPYDKCKTRPKVKLQSPCRRTHTNRIQTKFYVPVFLESSYVALATSRLCHIPLTVIQETDLCPECSKPNPHTQEKYCVYSDLGTQWTVPQIKHLGLNKHSIFPECVELVFCMPSMNPLFKQHDHYKHKAQQGSAFLQAQALQPPKQPPLCAVKQKHSAPESKSVEKTPREEVGYTRQTYLKVGSHIHSSLCIPRSQSQVPEGHNTYQIHCVYLRVVINRIPHLNCTPNCL